MHGSDSNVQTVQKATCVCVIKTNAMFYALPFTKSKSFATVHTAASQ